MTLGQETRPTGATWTAYRLLVGRLQQPRAARTSRFSTSVGQVTMSRDTTLCEEQRRDRAASHASQLARPAHLPSMPTPEDSCPLCGRPIPDKVKSPRHHLTPKLNGGARHGTIRLHQICHSAIHARYTEAEIARFLASRTAPRRPRTRQLHRLGPHQTGDFHATTRQTRTKTPKFAKPPSAPHPLPKPPTAPNG